MAFSVAEAKRPGEQEKRQEYALAAQAGKTCAICLDEMAAHQQTVVFCEYNHSYHLNCTAKFFKDRAKNHQLVSCPLCRQQPTLGVQAAVAEYQLRRQLNREIFLRNGCLPFLRFGKVEGNSFVFCLVRHTAKYPCHLVNGHIHFQEHKVVPRQVARRLLSQVAMEDCQPTVRKAPNPVLPHQIPPPIGFCVPPSRNPAAPFRFAAAHTTGRPKRDDLFPPSHRLLPGLSDAQELLNQFNQQRTPSGDTVIPSAQAGVSGQLFPPTLIRT